MWIKRPSIFGGRVKTLQPKIFGGILMRRDEEQDIKEAEANEINPIDDIRGSSAYKKRLAKQLITQHFIHFFPEKFKEYSLRQ